MKITDIDEDPGAYITCFRPSGIKEGSIWSITLQIDDRLAGIDEVVAQTSNDNIFVVGEVSR